MWILIIGGGGIMVTILGPLSIESLGEFSGIVTSGIKMAISLVLVAVWILILSKLKNWIFKKEIKSYRN